MRIWLVPAYIMFAGAAWCASAWPWACDSAPNSPAFARCGLRGRYDRRTHRGDAVPRQRPIADAHGGKPVCGGVHADNADEPRGSSRLRGSRRGAAATALHAAAIAILLTVAVFALERRGARNPTTAV